MNVKSKLSMLVLLVASLTATAQDDLLASIKKAGEVKAAMASFPPLLGISPTGQPNGYMADITNMALKGIGLPELKPVMTDWGAMIPSLQAKHVDIVMPGMQANELRCKAAAYSAPVFLQRQGLYVKAGNPKGITNAQQLVSRTDIKLAVVPGGNPDVYAQQLGVKPDNIIKVKDDQAGASTVIGGRADAYMTGQFSIRNLKAQNLEIVTDQTMPFVIYGIVFRKEDAKVRDAISQQINILRGNGKMRDTMMKFAADNGIAEKDMAAAYETLSKIQRIGEVVPACD